MESKNITEKFIDFINNGEALVGKYFDKPAKRTSNIIHYRLQTSVIPIESNFKWTASRVLSRGIQKAARASQQALHFLYNITEFLAKQPINLVRKPIAFLSNFVKAIAITSLIARGNETQEPERYGSKALKEIGKDMLRNVRDTSLATATMAVGVITLGAAPVFLASMGLTIGGAATISTVNGLSATGAALATTAVHNPVLNMAMNIESLGKGVYLGIEHYFTTPETMALIAKKNNRESEMEELIKLEKTFKDRDLGMNFKEEMHKEYNELKEKLATDALGSSRFGRAVLAINNAVTYMPRKMGLMEDNPVVPRAPASDESTPLLRGYKATTSRSCGPNNTPINNGFDSKKSKGF